MFLGDSEGPCGPKNRQKPASDRTSSRIYVSQVRRISSFEVNQCVSFF